MPSPYASAEEVFNAVRLRRPEEREQFLLAVCGDDDELRTRVLALLRADAQLGSFLQGADDGPAAQESGEQSWADAARAGTPDSGRGASSTELDPRATVVQGFASPQSARVARQGGVIGRYKLLQEIGQGGFGVVYMAEQQDPVRRRVALKVIKLGMDTRQVIARFDAERQALAIMDHANIAKVLDAGATESGQPFFVMELVKGDAVTEYCDRNSLTLSERLGLFSQICQAVQHAHSKGVIHRDLKPTNVLVTTQDGRPHAKVIDFGVAKATAARLTEKTLFTEFHQLIGTPEYMSPEQAEGSLDIDTRSDVYSLGVLLYELLTGTTPFDGQTLRSATYPEIQRIIREVEPPTPSTRLSSMRDRLPSVAACRKAEPKRLASLIRGDLDWIVMKCLEKDRSRRYETANGLALDVQRHLRHEPVVAGPPGRMYRLSKLIRRNRGFFAAGSVAALALLGGLGAATYGLVEANDQRSAAKRSADRAAAIKEFFFTSMIRAIDPEVARTKQPTIREVMDEAALRFSEITDPQIEADIRHEIGAVYLQLQVLDRTREHLERAAELRASFHGPSADADLADTLLELVELRNLTGAPADAESLALRARAIRVERFGEASLKVAEADYRLAQTYYRRGQQLRAAEINERTLVLLDRISPPGGESSIHAQVLVDYADHLCLRERVDEAVKLAGRAVEIHRRAGGATSLRLASALDVYGNALGMLGRFEEAEAALQESRSFRAARLPGTHDAIAQSLQALGLLRMRQGNLADAETLMRQALSLYAELGSEHEFVASTMVSLACTRALQDEFGEGERLCSQAMALYAKVFDSGDFRVASARTYRGACLARLGRFEEAESELLEAYRVLSTNAESIAMLRESLDALVGLYYHWGNAEKTAEWSRRLEEFSAIHGTPTP